MNFIACLAARSLKRGSKSKPAQHRDSRAPALNRVLKDVRLASNTVWQGTRLRVVVAWLKYFKVDTPAGRRGANLLLFVRL